MIYISGKITDKTVAREEKNIRRFAEKATELEAAGYEVHNPAAFTEEGWTWEQFLARDLKFIFDHKPDLYVLSNWEDSLGARLEVECAKLLGLSIEHE